MGDHNNSGENDLLTPIAYAQSLAPPRAPPFGSSQRLLLQGKKPSNGNVDLLGKIRPYCLQRKPAVEEDDAVRKERSLRRLQACHERNQNKLPHPHLAMKPNDTMERWLGTHTTYKFWNHLREYLTRFVN